MKQTIAIKSNDVFLKLYRRGNRSYHRFFTLYCLPNGTNGNRLGIHVGKKVGNAVTRNRIKRLVRESYRLQEDKLRKGFDIVITAREAAAELDGQRTAGKAFHHLAKQSGLLAVPKAQPSLG